MLILVFKILNYDPKHFMLGVQLQFLESRIKMVVNFEGSLCNIILFLILSLKQISCDRNLSNIYFRGMCFYFMKGKLIFLLAKHPKRKQEAHLTNKNTLSASFF